MTYKPKPPTWLGIGIDAWTLAADANMVIAMRIGAMAMGGPAATREARLMVDEKLATNMALGIELMTGKLGSNPASIASNSLAHYSAKVRANRRRLAK